jgi:membrane fusion protein, copper/silver efflux system
MKQCLIALAFAAVAASPAAASDLPTVLVDPYLRIQVALAADKTDGVTKNAASIAQAAEGLGGEGGKIADAARELEKSPDLRRARTAFGALSDAIMAYAKATGAKPPGDVKVAYCPMINKSWLQKGDAIRNPYYGAEMLECGGFR